MVRGKCLSWLSGWDPTPLAPATRREAAARGLDVDETIAERDRRLVGVVGGAIAALNYVLGEAADAGFEVFLAVAWQDVGSRRLRRRVIRGYDEARRRREGVRLGRHHFSRRLASR